MHLRYRITILFHLPDQFARVKLTIAPSSFQDLTLLLFGEILPLKSRSDNIAEESKDLVVRDGARVGEVVDADIVVLGQKHGCGQQIVEDGVGVFDVDDVLVVGDFGHEGSGMQVVGDGHA